MQVWEVSENTDMMRFYYFGTKKEAMAKRREIVEELGKEYSDHEILVDVKPIDVTSTKAGIAKALNFVIDRTCFNEG